MIEKYKHFSQTEPPNGPSRIFDVVKKNDNWAILANLSQYRYENNERSNLPTNKTQKHPFVVKSLSNSIANVSVKMQYEITSVQDLKTSWKKTHSINGGNDIHQNNDVKEKL